MDGRCCISNERFPLLQELVFSCLALLIAEITVILHCDSLLWNASSADLTAVSSPHVPPAMLRA